MHLSKLIWLCITKSEFCCVQIRNREIKAINGYVMWAYYTPIIFLKSPSFWVFIFLQYQCLSEVDCVCMCVSVCLPNSTFQKSRSHPRSNNSSISASASHPRFFLSLFYSYLSCPFSLSDKLIPSSCICFIFILFLYLISLAWNIFSANSSGLRSCATVFYGAFFSEEKANRAKKAEAVRLPVPTWGPYTWPPCCMTSPRRCPLSAAERL